MTNKKARKVLMAAGFDRNAANFALKYLKKAGLPENEMAVISALESLLTEMRLSSMEHNCSPVDVTVITIHCRGAGLVVRFAQEVKQ